MLMSSIEGSASANSIRPWTTMQVALAYHSKDQDVIYQTIMKMVPEEDVDWKLLTKISIPIWLKDR